MNNIEQKKNVDLKLNHKNTKHLNQYFIFNKLNENFFLVDSTYGWFVVFASFFCNVIVDGIIFSFGILLINISNDLNLPKRTTSWIGSLQTGFYLLIGPLASYLSNKYGYRAITITGSIISSIAFILSSRVNHVYILYITYGIIGGIGYGLIYLSSVVIVGLWFNEKRAFATGIAVCGSGIGGFVLPPITKFLINLYGWRKYLYYLAGLNLISIFFGLFFIEPKKNITTKLEESQGDLTSKQTLNTSYPIEMSVKSRNFSISSCILQNSLLNEKFKNRSQNFNKTSYCNQRRNRSISVCTYEQRKMSASLINFANFASIEHLYRKQMNVNLNLEQNEKVSKIKFLEISLISSPTFLLFCLASFLTLSGFFVPFMYIVDNAIQLGINPDKATILLSVIGATNSIGRIFCGWLTDRPNMNALAINNSALIINGLFTILLPIIYKTYNMMILYSFVFAFSIACFAALRSIIITELFGIECLTSGFGLVLLVQGIASMIGSPVAGWFYDLTNSYNYSFYASGSVILISGLISIPLPYILKWEQQKSLFNENKV